MIWSVDALGELFTVTQMHPAAQHEEDLLRECMLRRVRRSGPGGQHRNKTETAVVIQHVPTGISAEANERRSQYENKRTALKRLRLALAVKHRRQLADSPAPASSLWVERSRGGQIQVSVGHEDFPCLLAELLDALAACSYELGRCARHLNVSTTQLSKMLHKHPPALGTVNQRRAELGLRKLR